MTYQTYHHTRNYGCRVTEFVYQGYRCVAIENEKLRVSIAADKGTDIYEFLYKPRDVDFLWRSWAGMRAPYTPSSPRAAGAFMDYYEGGWQELFPNCGGVSVHQGAEVGQHGEVALLPWSYIIIENQPDRVEVRFEVRTVRTPFHLVKSISLSRNEAVLRIREKVTNEGGQEVDFTWGHHPAFGWPFINDQCRVYVPECLIRTYTDFNPVTSRLKPDQMSRWPIALASDGGRVDLSKIPGPDVATHDMVFLEELSDGWYAVVNQSSGVGFGFRYPAEVFKVLWYWQVYRGGRDYPWWGATYNMALEPCASLPVLGQAAQRGQALKLASGESVEVELLAVAFEHAGDVGQITAEAAVK
jgi:hypothetical protein